MRKIIFIFIFIMNGLYSLPNMASPPKMDFRPPGISGETWQFGPLNRWAYVHLREILPTKEIPNNPSVVSVISGLDKVSDDIVINLNNRPVKLSEIMENLFVDGVLVINDGTAVIERYGGYLTPDKPHILWSVSKTITGLTAAAVANDGLIDLDKTVSQYVPELAATGWSTTTLRDMLDMRDTSDWTEDYDAPDSTVRRQDCADGLLTGELCADTEVVGNYEFLPSVGRDDSRKGKFFYKSGTTDVIAWVLEVATGKRFADIVSEKIWKPIGAERSAGITVDVSGFTLASGGMFATLRDMGRIGQLMLNRGIYGDEQLIPADWMDDIFNQSGDSDIAQRSGLQPEWLSNNPNPYYRSFVWGLGDGYGTVYATGVHGQFVYVAPSTKTVIVMFSSWPNADGGADGVGPKEAMELLRALEIAVN